MYPKRRAVVKGKTNRPTYVQYKAEEEAIIHVAHIVADNVDNITPDVFLTDTLSVLQALTNYQNCTDATRKSHNLVLQWNPYH